MADDNGNGNGNGVAPSVEEFPVNSTCIASLSYDSEAGVAFYTFVNGGGQYQTPMSRGEVEQWANAESPGSYFNANVKGR